MSSTSRYFQTSHEKIEASLEVFQDGEDYAYSAPFAGIAIPSSFITICKSFQVSFF
jgi:hypothetical protein